MRFKPKLNRQQTKLNVPNWIRIFRSRAKSASWIFIRRSTLGGCHIFFFLLLFLPNSKIEVIRVFNVREQYNRGPRRTHPLRNDRNDTKFSLVLNEQALICYQAKWTIAARLDRADLAIATKKAKKQKTWIEILKSFFCGALRAIFVCVGWMNITRWHRCECWMKSLFFVCNFNIFKHLSNDNAKIQLLSIIFW